MRQRGGQLPHRRDPPHVGEVLAESLSLRLGSAARQGMGEHVSQQVESLHELVPPGALGRHRAERQGPDHQSLHRQWDRDLRLDAQAAIGLPIHPGFDLR